MIGSFRIISLLHPPPRSGDEWVMMWQFLGELREIAMIRRNQSVRKQ